MMNCHFARSMTVAHGLFDCQERVSASSWAKVNKSVNMRALDGWLLRLLINSLLNKK